MPSRNELHLARCPNPSRFKQGPLVSGDGKLLAVAGKNSGLVIHDVATGKRVQEFAGHVGGCSSLAFNADVSALVSGGFRGGAILWRVTTTVERITTSMNEPAKK